MGRIVQVPLSMARKRDSQLLLFYIFRHVYSSKIKSGSTNSERLPGAGRHYCRFGGGNYDFFELFCVVDC